jgi:hypothetical protein
LTCPLSFSAAFLALSAHPITTPPFGSRAGTRDADQPCLCPLPDPGPPTPDASAALVSRAVRG